MALVVMNPYLDPKVETYSTKTRNLKLIRNKNRKDNQGGKVNCYWREFIHEDIL